MKIFKDQDQLEKSMRPDDYNYRFLDKKEETDARCNTSGWFPYLALIVGVVVLWVLINFI